MIDESTQPLPPENVDVQGPIVKRLWDYLKASASHVKASVFTTRLYRSSMFATGSSSHTSDHDSEAADSDDLVNTPGTVLDVTDQSLHWYQQEINRLIEQRMKDSETCPWTDVAKCAEIQNLWKIILKRQLATKLRTFVDKAGVYKVVKYEKGESVLTRQTPVVDAVDDAYATSYRLQENLPLSWAHALCDESFTMSLAINEQCVNIGYFPDRDPVNNDFTEVHTLTTSNDILPPAIDDDTQLCEQEKDELVQCIKAMIHRSSDGEIRSAEVMLDKHAFKLWEAVQSSLPRRQNLAQYLITVPALAVCIRPDGTWISIKNTDSGRPLINNVLPAISDLLKHHVAVDLDPSGGDYELPSGGSFDTDSSVEYSEDESSQRTDSDDSASENRKDRLESALTERIRSLVTSLQQPVTLGPIGGDPRVKELWNKLKAVSEYNKLGQFIADSEAFVTEQEADTDTLLVSIPHDRSLDGVATAMSQ